MLPRPGSRPFSSPPHPPHFLQSESQNRPQYTTLFMPQVQQSHPDLWTEGTARYPISAPQGGYDSPPETNDFPESGYDSAPEIITSSNEGYPSSSHIEEPSSSSYGKPSYNSKHQIGGGGWSRVCKPSEAPITVISSAADIPIGSVLRDPFGQLIDIRDVVTDLIPIPPNVLRIAIRDRLPSNYSTLYVERVEVNLDSSSNINRQPLDVRTEAIYNGHTNPAPGSILNSNNQRPKANTLQISTFVVQTPNNSAPIDGVNNDNGFFQGGIDARSLKFPNRMLQNPLETQIRTLGQVFDQLQNIENRPLPQLRDSNTNSFANGIQIDAPLLSVQIERFTVPEPNSGERAMLDAYFNFGLAAHPFEFGDLDIIREQYEAIRNQRAQVSVNQLGSTAQEIGDTMTQWIRGYVKRFRESSAAAFGRAEGIAYEGFRQHQYFIHPPGECPIKIDPPYARGTTAMQCLTSGICLKEPPPSCIHPC